MRERSRTKDTKTSDPSEPQTKHHGAHSERSSPVRYSKYRSSVSYLLDEQHTTHVRGRGQRRSSVQDELVKFRASRSIPPEDAQKKFLLWDFAHPETLPRLIVVSSGLGVFYVSQVCNHVSEMPI